MEFLTTGFLPTRGSFSLDLIFVGMILICSVMLVSILVVRILKQVQVHRRIQTYLAMTLGVIVILFEIDVRFLTDWRQLAESSSLYHVGWVDTALWIHLLFAIPTPLIWGYVVYHALKKYHFAELSHENGAGVLLVSAPQHSHRFWGRVAATMMLLTSTTGCVFYWVAFAC